MISFYYSDEDLSSVQSSHTLTNETFNDGIVILPREKIRKSTNTNIHNEIEDSHKSMTPSSSYDSISTNIKENCNSETDVSYNIKSIRKHSHGNGKRKKPNKLCARNDFDSVHRTTHEATKHKQRKWCDMEKTSKIAKEKLEKATHTESNAKGICKVNNTSSASSSGSISGSTGDTNKRAQKNNDRRSVDGSNAHSNEDCTPNVNSAAKNFFQLGRLSGANELNISNSTLTNVNIFEQLKIVEKVQNNNATQYADFAIRFLPRIPTRRVR